jgi:hypothetical protein
MMTAKRIGFAFLEIVLARSHGAININSSQCQPIRNTSYPPPSWWAFLEHLSKSRGKTPLEASANI